MRKCIMTLFVLSICTVLFAQDIIVKRDGTRIDAIVNTINETEISYKALDNPDGPLYVISKSEVATIVYKSGKVETFEVKQEEQQRKENSSVQYPEIALEDIHGYVLKQGNCVYVPIDGAYDFERAGQLKLKELLKEWGYWIVVDDVKQAHFVIHYHACIDRCSPDVCMTYIRFRDFYHKQPSIDASDFGNSKYNGFVLDWLDTSENENVNINAACRYFNRIKAIMTDTNSEVYGVFHKYYEKKFNADGEKKRIENWWSLNWSHDGL